MRSVDKKGAYCGKWGEGLGDTTGFGFQMETSAMRSLERGEPHDDHQALLDSVGVRW